VLGDGECAEGAVWEAANQASLAGLDNLCAILDINRLGQSDPTMHEYDLDAYEKKFKAFGWNAIKIDGHNISQILSALKKARESKKPTAIVAKTIKGKGVSFCENRNGWHGKPLKPEDLQRALDELGPMPEIDAKRYVKKPNKLKEPQLKRGYRFAKSTYSKDTATRRAYGNALVNLGKVNDSVVCIDGDVKNSTYADSFFAAFPKRSFDVFIAEQNMVGIGIGMAARGYLPFLATFAAFLCRAHDQIRMAGYSFSNMKFVGSHVGVSIGADGPSQMGLEDLALFRPIPGCAVLYPSDAYSTEGCVEAMAKYRGLSYLRTTRPATACLYKKSEEFPIGGSKVLKKSQKDKVAVIAAGITVHEALIAYEELKKDNVPVRVIDAYSIQPMDPKIRKEVEKAGNKVVVVEDHFRNGGLGDAVAALLAGQCQILHLAVDELPRSGEPQELLEKYGLSAKHIKQAVKQLVKKK
jgi:transketolase